MKAEVIEEAGLKSATFGFSLSWNSTISRSQNLLPTFAFKQGGENKFLEHIMIWINVIAPRYWWQEADTYRVGTSKQSESTMHTVTKRLLTSDDFEGGMEEEILKHVNQYITMYQNTNLNGFLKKKYFLKIKQILPEAFLQRREWMMSYKGLQNIYNQRHDHKLPEWGDFFDDVFSGIQHPEFIRSKL